jgi:hypothetical protein
LQYQQASQIINSVMMFTSMAFRVLAITIVALMMVYVCNGRAIPQKDVGCCNVRLESIYGVDACKLRPDDPCCQVLTVCDPADMNKHNVLTRAYWTTGHEGIVEYDCHVDLPLDCPPPPKALTLSFADFAANGVYCTVPKPDGSGEPVAIAFRATITPSGNIYFKCAFKP